MRKLLFGTLLVFTVAVANGVITGRMIGLSYDMFQWQAYASVYPVIETEALGAAACNDGLDNDLDGLVDCDDPDCIGLAGCPAPAPVTSPGGFLLLVAMLTLVGFFSATRARTRVQQADGRS